jgi:ArsR family transcriptional regulator
MEIDIMDSMSVDLDIFAEAIGDKTRREIMKRLCCVWLSVGDVVAQLDGRVNQPTVSHHLRKLEEAKLVSVRQEGRQRFYTLNRDRVKICCGLILDVFQVENPETVISPDEIPVREG